MITQDFIQNAAKHVAGTLKLTMASAILGVVFYFFWNYQVIKLVAGVNPADWSTSLYVGIYISAFILFSKSLDD